MTNLTKERLKIYVPEEAASLLEKLGEFLQQRNIDCYVVGGFVRDGLMGRTNSDIDLAVAGDAIEIASEVAKAFDARMVPLDEVNQVARVVFPKLATSGISTSPLYEAASSKTLHSVTSP